MLKGYVFKEQIFESQVFAYFIDTFLNKQCGVGNFGNNMEVIYDGNNITIQDGIACIRGRFVGEDSYTTLDVGTDNYYCKLVIEINLNQENTEEMLKQASYKIIKNVNSYPNLIQTDIVKSNTGIYQYELARFRTSASGITDFQDMRTFIELGNIFNAYTTIIKNINEDSRDGSCIIDYPKGLNARNTAVLSVSTGYFDTNSSWTEIINNTSITYGRYFIDIVSDSIKAGNAVKIVLLKT